MPTGEPPLVDSSEPDTASFPAGQESERTAPAPVCPPILPPVALKDRGVPSLAVGQIIEDYEIVRLLGAGAFARVYLARQVSLNRPVALKVSANQGSEARTLARLEHQHIVQVFAEIVLIERNLRLLSMQFVAGVTLARIISALAKEPAQSRDGRAFVAILDRLCTEATTFDLGGLEVRAYLQTCDPVELACWIGARLAEALAHAHSQGIIHRDIKPANILVNRYGRPFLADFNIALDTESGTGTFGGTVAYMAPEQVDAFLPDSGVEQSAVGTRSDLYSLALVLFEFLTGELPFSERIDEKDRLGSLRALSRERHAGAPSPRTKRADVPELMDRLLRRCLEPDAEKRFATAAALMHALDGCRDLLQVENEPGEQGRLVRISHVRPFLMLVLLGICPHVVGSVVNIIYNQQIIVTKDAAAQASFQRLVLEYNAIVYPVLVAVAIFVMRRSWLGWVRVRSEVNLPSEDAARIRRQALALWGWVVAISCLGWFPGGFVFPFGLHLDAVPLEVGDWIHFLSSFVISGLIATIYTYFAAQFIVLRILYPQLWSDPSSARETMQSELSGVPAQLRRFQIYATLIPLLGTAILIGAGGDLVTRVLALALLALGVAGFFLATHVTNRLIHVVALLTGRPFEAGRSSLGAHEIRQP